MEFLIKYKFIGKHCNWNITVFFTNDTVDMWQSVSTNNLSLHFSIYVIRWANRIMSKYLCIYLEISNTEFKSTLVFPWSGHICNSSLDKLVYVMKESSHPTQ